MNKNLLACRLLLLAASMLTVEPAFSGSGLATPGTQKQLEKLLLEGAGAPTDVDITRLYRNRNFKSFWISAGRPTPRAAILRSFLEQSSIEGLLPQRYQVAKIARLWRKSDDASLAHLEVTLTQAYGLYVMDVSQGRSDLRQLDEPSLQPARDRVFLSHIVQKGLDAPDLDRFLRQLPPRDDDYPQLKAALQIYRSTALRGGWKSIAPGPMLKVGMSDPRIPWVRQRLVLTADSGGAEHSSAVYDKELENSVRRFQIRHYLPHEGIIGPATVAAMNVPVEQRIRQIIVNMERRRWSAVEPSGKYILVNIPGFELSALRDGHVELTMPVVVGKAYQQTPVFDDQMEYLEFNPHWLVPPALAANEYLPELRQDPAALMPKHIRIFEGLGKDAPEVDPKTVNWMEITPAKMIRYALRQDPGPWNALGTLKFMFPNRYNVYFHDTSEPRFFSQRQRTFSHGCIRVSRPDQLAVWVLEEEKSSPWSIEQIRAAVATGQHQTVRLRKPIPVYIAYRTVLMGDDRSLHFLPDIYSRDTVLEKSLVGD